MNRTAVVAALAVLVRIPVFILASRGFFVVGEGRVQLDLARNILEGRGFQLSPSMLYPEDDASSEMRDHQMAFYREVDGFYGVLRPGRPTTVLVPGTALFQAGIMGVFGTGNMTAVLGAQLALGVLTVLMGLRIAERFFRGRWLTAAGILMAVDPYELYYEAVPATQALFSLLFIGALLLSFRMFEKTSSGRGILAGLIWGGAFMVRPVALPFLILAGVLVLIFRRFSLRSLLTAAAMLLGFFMVLLPWGIRNRSVTGRFMVMPAQGGLQLWEFNGRVFSEHFKHEMPGAILLYQPIRDRWMGNLRQAELAEFPDFTHESEHVRDSVLTHRQIRFLSQNPGVLPELVSMRFVEFFKPFPLNEFSIIHTMSGILFFFWITVFMVPGGILLLRKPDPGAFLIVLGTGGYVLLHLLVASGTPHRVAVDYPLIIMSLLGLKTLVSRWTA